MYTSVILAALTSGAVVPAEAPPAVQWQPSYAAARQESGHSGKPVAVFVGSGPEGWKAVSGDKELTPPARQALNDKYLCVYVDTNRPEGRRLADAFAINGGPGLVLSTPGGENQAFYHDGELSGADLENSLSKYAEPGRAVTRTETLGTPAVRYSYTPGRAVAPAAYAPSYVPAFYPSAGFGGFPGGFGGFSGGFGGRGGC
jgi:hypothetical protein